jgi:hypothetical protein
MKTEEEIRKKLKDTEELLKNKNVGRYDEIIRLGWSNALQWILEIDLADERDWKEFYGKIKVVT